MILKGLKGRKYELESTPFKSGGEGSLYGLIGRKDQVVKIYHPGTASRDLEEKLKIMVSKPPEKSVMNQVAWPLDVLYDSAGRFCGFAMPRLNVTAELSEIYVYPPQSNITYLQKLILAQNICAVIDGVHKAGYVFGDFNPRNIGINLDTGSVAFFDTDTYHIVIDEKANKAYRCSVSFDGYVAPELLKKCESYPHDAYALAPLPTFTQATDNFALAIHIYKLMMNGYSPFNGIRESGSASTASPGIGNEAIKRDSYCFKPGNKPMAAAVPSLDVLPDQIQKLLNQAFIDGRKNPAKRPSASQWYKALEAYEKSLVPCFENKAHSYKKGLSKCPWCEADQRYQAAMSPNLKQKSFQQPVRPIATAVQKQSVPTSSASASLQTGAASTKSVQSKTAASSLTQRQKSSPVYTKPKKKPTALYSLLRGCFAVLFILYSAWLVYLTCFAVDANGISKIYSADLGLLTIGYLLIVILWAYFERALDDGSSTWCYILPPICFAPYGMVMLGCVILDKYYRHISSLGWFDHFILKVLGNSEWLAWKLLIVAPVVCLVAAAIAGWFGKRTSNKYNPPKF